MKRFLLSLWILMPVCSPVLVSAQTLDSLEDVCSYARANSLDYQTALWEALKSSRDLDGILEFEESSFSFDTSVREDEDVSANAGVDVPVLDQISLNASLDSDKNRAYGFTLSPLAHRDDRIQQELARQEGSAAAAQTGIAAENSALKAVLDWLSVMRTVDVQKELTSVLESIYRDEKVRYEAGESTLDDVRSALMDWTDAGKTLTSLQNDRSSAELSLLSALNTGADSISLPDLDSSDLERELEALQGRMKPDQADPLQSYEVLTAQIEARSLEEELKDTWLFDPDLSLTGSISTDDSGDSSWSGTLSLSFSFQDWQSQEREELSRDLELSRLEAGQVQVEQYQALQQDLIALETTKQSCDLARLELEEAMEIYDEAEFLLERGEYSRAERDEARLDLKTAEVSLFSALADEYSAWRELLYYFPSY